MKIPKDLENQQSTVQTAVSEIASSLAQVGIPFDPKDAEQAKAFEDFLRPEGDKSAGEGLETVVEQAPAVRVARAAVARAEKQLDDARLRLSWTEVRSEIAGYVQDRQVHPGNRVEPGQTLLSIRPDLRLDRRQLQGDADPLHPDRHAGRPVRRRLPAPGLPGAGGGLQPRHGAVGVAPAAGERHRQLRQGDPAAAGADRAGRAEPGRHPAVRRPVGRAARPDQGAADRARAGQRLHTYGRLRPPDVGGGPAGSQPRNRDDGRRPAGHEHGIRQRHGGDGPKVKAPVNHWIVALTVTLATFMEVLDTSIANVALPYIAGGLAVGRSQATWVLTSYLVANAIVLPLSGWLMGLFGRKRFYMTCVFLFTVSSALCGAAPNIELLIFFRVLQGLGGGGLQPSEQGILVDTFPPRQLGMAMAMYGVAVVVAPILGPVLGGYISDNYSWRWIFYINIPIGIVSLILTSFIVQDPPGMDEEVRKNWKARPEDRLHRPGPGLARAGLARGPLRQGPGMGLVRRPVLAGPDLLRRDGGRPGRSSSGSSGTPTRWSTSGCWASAISSPAG